MTHKFSEHELDLLIKLSENSLITPEAISEVFPPEVLIQFIKQYLTLLRTTEQSSDITPTHSAITKTNVLSQKKDILSWDETFMGIASVVKLRSKDPSTQVGACIVGPDKRILSVGYNGAPNKFPDSRFPWGKTAENPLDTKYPYVVHAERNAILNFRGVLREFEGATVYVTHFPCHECAKEIIQSGIKEVVFLTPYYASDGLSEASVRMFKECGVEYRQFWHAPLPVTLNEEQKRN